MYSGEKTVNQPDMSFDNLDNLVKNGVSSDTIDRLRLRLTSLRRLLI